ncbi:LysR family transcriptional regulator [Symbiobacterium terraclitae]|jgi:DNA-binding transcriptional LysR family regulator|uniref:LysR family transcriptional regulator n=1 Tax=Symbiobacterium terraclitae TaxID=557451 RepID=UPI0035B50330
MDVQGLEAFWWIAKTGSFNRAAERLFLTQPSVTARIQALEKELGQQLFERRPRGVRLTDAGRALLPHAERVLQDIKRARQAVLGLQNATGGTLSVGSALTTSAYLLPEILTRFKALHPAVEVLVHTGRSHQVQQLVLDDTVQVGLVHAPLPSHAEIVTYPLSEEPILLVVPPDHPVASRPEVSLDELTQESFITTDRASGYWALVEQWWASQGFVPHITMELDSIEAAKRMVLCGLGLTLLPHSTVKAEIALGQVVAVPLANSANLRRQNILIHRRGKIWSGTARAFLRTVGEMFNVDLGIGNAV